MNCGLYVHNLFIFVVIYMLTTQFEVNELDLSRSRVNWVEFEINEIGLINFRGKISLR